LKSSTQFRVLLLATLLSAITLGGCTAAFGPGYTIEKQSIDVKFQPGPPPRISIQADYDLRNTGTRSLSSIEVRLPFQRRFKTSNLQLKWDNNSLTPEPSPDFPRNSLLNLPNGWAIADTHTLHVSMDLESSGQDEPSPYAASFLNFAPDAFFLPAQGWSTQLLPTRGLMGKGGSPPPKWLLTVHVPKDFVVHTSGGQVKNSKHGDELSVRATQRSVDVYPFVIAGRYMTKQIGSPSQQIYLWTRTTEPPGDLRQVSDALIKTLDGYNSLFGGRTLAQVQGGIFSRRHKPDIKHAPPLWLVECPVRPGCFTEQRPGGASFFGNDSDKKPGEMISLDSAMIDPGASGKDVVNAAGPALAATWLGYGQSPGFYEQDPPLSAFPAFAAAVGSEALNGPNARTENIRRALALVPKDNSSAAQNETSRRAKNFLFFYGLQDRYGNEAFRKAVRHMLDAERDRGFNLYDLIAAFDQETHENTAAFVRLWMKHPGVPAEFRAKYENTSANTNTSEEVRP
jgi:hypothetical protein